MYSAMYVERVKMSADVSVIIPAYNAAGFLFETLDSVFNQTGALPEIIVVNDGSTDNTEEVLKSYFEKIKYIKQVNSGVSLARNRGFQESSGKYVVFMDADDWFYPDNIKIKSEFLDKNPEYGIVQSVVEYCDDKLSPVNEVKGFSSPFGQDDTAVYDFMVQKLLNLIPPAVVCPSNVMIRRSVLEDVGVFDLSLSTSADFDLWNWPYRKTTFEIQIT